MVDGHIPLSEISSWDLEDIYKALSYMDMKRDHELADSGFEKARIDDLDKRK